MEIKFLLVAVGLVGLVSVSGCTGCTGDSKCGPGEEISKPVKECMELCNKTKDEADLSKGPCLSDIREWNVSNWVCDVAHEPRQAVDNKRENQCDGWHQGKAENFVEVTPNCDFIRTG